MARTKAQAKKKTLLEPPSRTDIVVAVSAVAKRAPLKSAKPIVDGVGGIKKKKHRFRPGTVALREIRSYQKSVQPLIPLKTFTRLVREVAQERHENLRFQRQAILLLREASEMHLITTFSYTQLAAIHARRITIMAPDMKHVVGLLQSENIAAYQGSTSSLIGERQPRSEKSVTRVGIAESKKKSKDVVSVAEAAAAEAKDKEVVVVAEKELVLTD
jgi:histone H3